MTPLPPFPFFFCVPPRRLGDDDDDTGSSGSASQVLGGHLLADPFADTFLVGSTVNGDLFQWTVVTSDDGVARGEAADSREYGHHLPGLRLAVSSFLPTLPGAATCADVSTTTLPHLTPPGFARHRRSRRTDLSLNARCRAGRV